MQSHKILNALFGCFFIAISFFSSSAIAEQNYLELSRKLSDVLKMKSVATIRYFHDQKELDLTGENWSYTSNQSTFQIASVSKNNMVLFGIPETVGVTSNIQIAAQISRPRGKAISLPVHFKQFEVKVDKELFTFRVPFFRIPRGTSQRTIHFTQQIQAPKNDAIEELGRQLVLSKNIPTDRAILTIKLNAKDGQKLIINNQGFNEKKMFNEFGQTHVEFTLANKFTHLQSAVGNAPRINTFYKTWQDIASEHASFYQRELSKDVVVNPVDWVMTQFPANTSKDKDLVKKIAYQVFSWMGKNIQYRRNSFSVSQAQKFGPRSLDEIYRTQFGDCKDFTAFAVKLLAMSGIESEPVEVKLTDEWGPESIIAELPKEGLFNHVILYIPVLDEYFDMATATESVSSHVNFGIQSALYARTLGLHLFSGKLKMIRPDLLQSDFVLNTNIHQLNATWIGKTEWKAKGGALRLLELINARRKSKIEKGSSYDQPFKASGFEEISQSWQFSPDYMNGEGTITFSFEVTRDESKNIAAPLYFPKNIMTGAFFKDEFVSDVCLASEHWLEKTTIKLLKLDPVDVPLVESRIYGSNAKFEQSMEISVNEKKLTREFQSKVNGRVCGAEDDVNQITFYEAIKKAKSLAHKK